MKPKTLLPIEILTESFTYDPENGKLFWKNRPLSHFSDQHWQRVFNAKYPGTEAGHEHFQRDDRRAGIRVLISFNAKPHHCYAHKIIYALMGIEVPLGFHVDHKDGNPFNNLWSNLRLATGSQNCANRRKGNGPLPKGVRQYGDKFIAQIGIGGIKRHLGIFLNPSDAHAAYCAKAKELSGEFARFN